MKLETLILSNLIHDIEYARSVLPFIRPDYFSDNAERDVYNIIDTFYKTYNKSPNADILTIELQNDKTLKENDYTDRIQIVQSLVEKPAEFSWLLHETEKFCKDRAIYNAILKSISIIDGKDKEHNQDGIPSLLGSS